LVVTTTLNGFIIEFVEDLLCQTGAAIYWCGSITPPLLLMSPPSKSALTLSRVTGYFDAIDVAESSRQ